MAAREHADAVVRLVQHEGSSSHAEYNRLRTVVTEAHERCDKAGMEFEQHVAAHGCGVITNESVFSASAHVRASAGV